jgi:thymidylate kinase
MLITFSGLDGAGKSTLIARLRSEQESAGRRVQILTMYDHVGLYPLIRKIRDLLIGGAATDPPNTSTDPDRLGVKAARRPGPLGLVLSLLRSRFIKRCVLIMDLVVLALVRLWVELVKGRLLILDRYFYDSLADVIDGQHWGFARFVLRLVPVPDLPIFIDVAPEVAFTRKGEYTVAYMHRRRAVYCNLFSWVKGAVILENDNLTACTEQLIAIAKQRLKETT